MLIFCSFLKFSKIDISEFVAARAFGSETASKFGLRFSSEGRERFLWLQPIGREENPGSRALTALE